MFMLKDMRPPPRNMSVCFAGWPFQCACVNQSGCSHVVVPCFEGGDFWKTQGKWDGKMVPLEDKLQAYTIWAAESSGGGN